MKPSESIPSQVLPSVAVPKIVPKMFKNYEEEDFSDSEVDVPEGKVGSEIAHIMGHSRSDESSDHYELDDSPYKRLKADLGWSSGKIPKSRSKNKQKAPEQEIWDSDGEVTENEPEVREMEVDEFAKPLFK